MHEKENTIISTTKIYHPNLDVLSIDKNIVLKRKIAAPYLNSHLIIIHYIKLIMQIYYYLFLKNRKKYYILNSIIKYNNLSSK